MAQDNPPRRDTATSPLVVKVGGSLFSQVQKIVPILRASPRPLLVIPGGGPFADAVRLSGAGDDAAHWMAIAAMEQYGWVLAAQGLETTAHPVLPKKTHVLLPYCMMREHDPLPHTWSVTSDTIAAWVASSLGAELLLLKSVDGISINGVLQECVTEPVKCDVVDPCFIPYVLKNQIPATILNGMHLERLHNYFRREPVPGTRIGTTF